jgi:hypothetical protein
VAIVSVLLLGACTGDDADTTTEQSPSHAPVTTSLPRRATADLQSELEAGVSQAVAEKFGLVVRRSYCSPSERTCGVIFKSGDCDVFRWRRTRRELVVSRASLTGCAVVKPR